MHFFIKVKILSSIANNGPNEVLKNDMCDEYLKKTMVSICVNLIFQLISITLFHHTDGGNLEVASTEVGSL